MGINHSTLHTVALRPANSIKVASARPIGIWMMMDITMITILLRNANQNSRSPRSLLQLDRPTKVLSAAMPFHL